tara:strand:+ start:363 stop:1262 length:900 start_codon:yes stop_codon:yes gene_type:complete
LISRERVSGALLGLACGDAIGAPVEFKLRGTFTPLTGMTSGGAFNLKAGQWTDDTSMALCLAHSLIKCCGMHLKDQMDRYCSWWQDGYMSSTGECFDIGWTVKAALEAYLETGQVDLTVDDGFNAGNGALMRLAPVAMAYHFDKSTAIEHAKMSTMVTHKTTSCIEASALFCEMLVTAFSASSKDEVVSSNQVFDDFEISSIANGHYLEKLDDYTLGGGYVVDSLASALYCFYKGESFEDSVLMAANMGNDADTTAAICGQLSGAFYGADAIPKEWLDVLTLGNDIRSVAQKLYALKQL